MIGCNTEQRKLVKSFVNALRKDMNLPLSRERKSIKLPKKYRIMMNKGIREIKEAIDVVFNDFLDKDRSNNRR